ncbi:MAG: LysR family transcriptional regulator [Sneathiellaceae bacterium]
MKLWVKIDLPGRGQIGPGKIALLRAVDAQHSISGAARALKMSYRRAWMLLDETSRMLGQPVVETHMGGSRQGGADLTAAGRTVIACYEDALARANAAAVQPLQKLLTTVDAPDS